MVAAGSMLGCGRPTGVPESSPDSTQKLPFDREASSKGRSPSQTLIPTSSRLSEGTPLVVSLRKELTSASARTGDSFEGIIDEPLVVDEQALIGRGTAVTGRVLEAQPSKGNHSPGYLRIALVSVDLRGRTVPIDTSSIFVKAKGAGRAGAGPEIVFTPDRRLTFRLVQAIELP